MENKPEMWDINGYQLTILLHHCNQISLQLKSTLRQAALLQLGAPEAPHNAHAFVQRLRRNEEMVSGHLILKHILILEYLRFHLDPSPAFQIFHIFHVRFQLQKIRMATLPSSPIPSSTFTLVLFISST